MRLLPRSLRALRPRSRRFARPCLEALELRTVPTVIGLIPGAGSGTGALDSLVQPTFERYPTPNPLSAGESPSDGETIGAQPDSFGGPTPSGYTPLQIRTAYGISSIEFGSLSGTGAGQTIALVDAYDDPAFVDSTSSSFSNSDLAQFDKQFGLPDPPSFLKLNQNGGTTNLPGTDPAGAGNPQGNWEVEEALDVEWAHAIAPAASIVLIECNSNSSNDLYAGMVAAAARPGVSVVSLSWGSSEFNGEQTFDSEFAHAGVTVVASTGDDGSPGEYPAYSPNVLAVGGTNLFLGSNNSYGSETGWSGSGGGISSFESEPAYQDAAQSTGRRTIPDVAFDAAPNTGVAVYDSYNNTNGHGPWEQVGGTSLSAPSWAGLIAIADQGRVAAGGTTLTGPTQTLPALYSLPSADFNDITSGSNGGFSAQPGYDEVTGLGTPKANLLVPALAAYGTTAAASQLAVTAQPPSSTTAGAPFGLTIAVENANGSLNTSYSGSVTIELSNNPGGSTLGGTLTVTAQNGVATFIGLTLNRTGSGYTIQATTSGSTTVLTNAMSVTPAAAYELVVIAEPPANVAVNSRFGLTVAVEDRFGNIETNTSTSKVTVALAINPGDAALGGTLSVNFKQGIATFSNLSVNKLGRNYAILVSSPGLSKERTASFNVLTIAAAKQALVESQTSYMIAARRATHRVALRPFHFRARRGTLHIADVSKRHF
jgi:subtilase family serine protease